jgi:glycosyltransferase involved in cell wall biosynthesis
VKVSIIIAVLNSHKVVVRQIRHFRKMGLSNDVEILLVDDGSNPPISFNSGMANFNIYYTNDKRPWTQGLARNLGASKAKGEYLFITDIDHIITREAIEAVRNFDGDLMNFPRKYGILDRYGTLVTDEKSMLAFGALPRRVNKHANTFAMRRSIFEAIGGYDRKHCERLFHVGGKVTSEEGALFSKYKRIAKGTLAVSGPMTYFYPTGRFRVDGNTNPYGLFHGLSIEPVPQPMLE